MPNRISYRPASLERQIGDVDPEGWVSVSGSLLPRPFNSLHTPSRSILLGPEMENYSKYQTQLYSLDKYPHREKQIKAYGIQEEKQGRRRLTGHMVQPYSHSLAPSSTSSLSRSDRRDSRNPLPFLLLVLVSVGCGF